MKLVDAYRLPSVGIFKDFLQLYASDIQCHTCHVYIKFIYESKYLRMDQVKFVKDNL